MLRVKCRFSLNEGSCNSGPHCHTYQAFEPLKLKDFIIVVQYEYAISNDFFPLLQANRLLGAIATQCFRGTELYCLESSSTISVR